MGDWAYNPLHGWSQGPFDAINCDYPSFSYFDPTAFSGITEGFFPAPPGFMWADPSILGGGLLGGCSGVCGMGNMMGGCGGGCGLQMMSGGLGVYPGMMGMLGMVGGPYPSGQTWQQIGTEPVDGGTPGINVKNFTGGIGLEPGCNYIFPDEHVKVHVFKTKCPPWQLEGTEQIEYQSHMVPTCVTVKTMMSQFGCNNSDAKKNVVYELAPGGNGKWYKGLSMKGDEAKKMGKRVGDLGWAKDGDPVWLYFTKD